MQLSGLGKRKYRLPKLQLIILQVCHSMFTLRQMYWYNKKSWSYFSHAYFAEGKSLTFYLARCCCLRSGKRGPHWRAPVCLPSALRLHHRGLSKMKDSGVRMPRNFFHSSHSNSKWRTERKPGEEGRRGKVYTLAFVKCAKHRYCLHSVIILQQRQAEEVQRFTS